MNWRFDSSLADWLLFQCTALLILLLILVAQIHAQTQASMNAQARADFARVDAELNKIYQSVLANLPDAESKEKLKQSQRAWLASRDAEAARAADEAGGGSMAPTMRYGKMTHLTRERIKELVAMLYPEVPKEYEVGEDTISPDGRFAILYEVRDEDSNVDPGLPNLLVRLKPYAVLKEIESDQGVTWKGGRGAPDAKWNGNEFVAIWQSMKWGHENLVVYEIANDTVKQARKIWPQVVKYFDRDFHERFLKKYPKEPDGYTFVSDSRVKELEFKDHKLLLDIFADNKPNLAAGPHWTAELRGVWNLDTGKFDKVDFRPGRIEVRRSPEEEQ